MFGQRNREKLTDEVKKRKRWDLIPVPEPRFHGDWCPDDLMQMRDAVELEYHPDEPEPRKNMRAWKERNPGDFNTAKIRLETELRQRVDRWEEEEKAKAAKAAEKVDGISSTDPIVSDLGSDKVRELGRRLLEELNAQIKEPT